MPYTAWDGISKVLPNITVHLFDKSGHWAFVEEPDRFDTALREWVTRLGLGGKSSPGEHLQAPSTDHLSSRGSVSGRQPTGP